MAGNQMAKLPVEVRKLINEGVFALYSVADSPDFVLVTDDRKMYLLSEEGEIKRSLDSIKGFKLLPTVNIAESSQQNSLKINYA